MQQIRDRTREMTAGFTSGQKTMMALAFVSVVGGLWVMSHWAPQAELAPLYTNLATSDAAAVSEQLDSAGVKYELTDGGRSILVARDSVYKVRLQMSSQGLPEGGSPGYSLLDKQGITSTQFQQRVAFQRALEGELGRTITDLDAVDAASIHLVIPKDNLFVGDAIKSSASVLVKTRATLGAEQVQAIVNLVAGSVEGLLADDVTVTDQSGLVLAAPGQSPMERSAAGGGTSKTHEFESRLASDIEEMLTAAVGPDKAVVTVAADMDWDSTSNVTEVYTPSVVPAGSPQLGSSESTVTETYSTDSPTGTSGVLGGTTSPPSSLPSATSNYSKTDAKHEYVYDSSRTSTDKVGGVVKRLNVAVLLDEATVTAAQATTIESLVTAASGLDTTRGDTLAISRLTFDTTIKDAIAAQAAALPVAPSSAGGLIQMGVVGGLVLLITIVAAIQLWRGRRRIETEELDLSELTRRLAAPVPASVNALSSIAPVAASGKSNGDAAPGEARPIEDLQVLVDQQPDEVARLLRAWLADRRVAAQ